MRGELGTGTKETYYQKESACMSCLGIAEWLKTLDFWILEDFK